MRSAGEVYQDAHQASTLKVATSRLVAGSIRDCGRGARHRPAKPVTRVRIRSIAHNAVHDSDSPRGAEVDGCSSSGRAAVSKAARWRFESSHPCRTEQTNGMWRSLVARSLWVRKVRGSSPCIPPSESLCSSAEERPPYTRNVGRSNRSGGTTEVSCAVGQRGSPLGS